MKIHRIYASDMRQGRKDLVAELGEDAVILKTQTTAGGVVIYATLAGDYELSMARATAEAKMTNRRQARVGAEADNIDEAEQRKQAQIALLTGQINSQQKTRRAAEQRAPRPAARPVTPAKPAPRKGASRPDSELARELELASKRIADAHLKSNQADVELLRRNRQLAEDRDIDGILAPISKKAHIEAGGNRRAVEPEEFEKFKTEVREMQTRANQAQYRPPAPTSYSNNRLTAELVEMGVSASLSEQLAAGIEQDLSPAQARKRLLSRLSDALEVEHTDLLERGGMIAFLGATGVGKTTTIGKLAAKYVLEHGSAGVALVTTDTFRIAAYEQLKTFGRILDVPVKVVDESTTLSDVLHNLRHKRLVLVDTAGLNSGEDNSEYQIAMLDAVPLRMKKLLVVSASTQRAVMDKTYATYRDVGLNGCLVTKLDEAGDLGSVLSFSIEHSLTITYVTDGQKVPDDIYPARKQDLVSRALTKRAELDELELKMRREQSDDSTTPTRFGS